MHAKSLQACPALCNPMACNPPGSSVHGILQARILKWIAMPSSRITVIALVYKAPTNPRVVRDVGSVSGLGRSLGGGHGNPLQYSCLENPMDRGAWQIMVHGVTKS